MDKRLDDLLNQITGEMEDEDSYEETGHEEYVSPMDVPVVYEEQKTSLVGDEDLIQDYKFTRNTLYGLIDRGQRALEHALKIATESEHPRSLEVANGLLGNIANVSKQLIDLQKLVRDIDPDVEDGAPVNNGNITNNTILVQNTSQLDQILKSIDGECEEIDEKSSGDS